MIISFQRSIVILSTNVIMCFMEGNECIFQNVLPKTQVIWIFRSINKEQDNQSPHLYLTAEFQVDINSIVVDAGVAEGNFALSVVEKAKILYLIECDTEWMEALRLTFAPWKEKVVFCWKVNVWYRKYINNFDWFL